MKSAVGLWIDHSQASIAGVETTGKMTKRQIVARTRQYF